MRAFHRTIALLQLERFLLSFKITKKDILLFEQNSNSFSKGSPPRPTNSLGADSQHREQIIRATGTYFFRLTSPHGYSISSTAADKTFCSIDLYPGSVCK